MFWVAFLLNYVIFGMKKKEEEETPCTVSCKMWLKIERKRERDTEKMRNRFSSESRNVINELG